MSKSELAKAGSNLPANPADLLSGLAIMGAVDANDGGRGQFMRFTKKGEYLYGRDGLEIEEGSLWAVDPRSFVHGYQAWGIGKILGEAIASMQEAPIVKSSLPTHSYIDPKDDDEKKDAKWAPFRGFVLVCTNGEDEGEQCFLSGTSLGLRNATSELIKEIVTQMQADPGSPVPIVELTGDNYKHNTWGVIEFPIFKIKEWVTMEATVVPDSEADESEEEAPADPGPNPSPQEEVAEEEESAKPTKKTRGRKAAATEPTKPTAQRRTRRRSA